MDSATLDEGISVDAAVLQSKVLSDAGAINIAIYDMATRKIQTQRPDDSPKKRVLPPAMVSGRFVKGKVMNCVSRSANLLGSCNAQEA